jgi:hypothetical protein
MKKILLLSVLLFQFFYSPAQEMITGGNMEDESAWTVIDVGSAFDASTITFDCMDNTPKNGKGGCLSISAAGVSRNFIYQKVSLTKGHTYYLSCAFKNVGDPDISSYWVELNLVNREPVLVGDGTGADFGAGKSEYQIGMNYWKSLNGVDYSRIAADYDGLMEKTLNFVYLGAGAKGGDSIFTNPRDPDFKGLHGDSIIFTLPDTVTSKDWYVLIKAGAFMTAGATAPVYNWLFDELTLWDMAEPLKTSVVQLSDNQKFRIYPNPIRNGIINIKSGFINATSYCLYSGDGRLVKAGYTNGTIETGNLRTGMYLITLSNGSSYEGHKIFIE